MVLVIFIDFLIAIRHYEIINIKSDIRLAIDQAFRNNEIKIPFPQRDLHLVSDSRKD